AWIVAGVDFDGVEAFLAQGLDHAASRRQRYFAFGGTPAHQDRDAVVRAHDIPTRLISHSSAMPDLALTRARTSSPSASISAALLSPVLLRKLQCFSLPWAAPTINPRQPAASINCHALWPSGFLKVEPPVLARMGWVASRCATSAFMRARMASGRSATPSN